LYFGAGFASLLIPVTEQSSLWGTAQREPLPISSRAPCGRAGRQKFLPSDSSSFLPFCLFARFASAAAGFWKGERRKMRLPQPFHARAFEFSLLDFN